MEWGQVWSEILELFYPPRCAVCEQIGEAALCASCREQIEYLTSPYCLCCGRPLLPSANENVVCGECRTAPPAFGGARAVGLHTGVLRTAVLRMKFNRCRELVQPLGQMLAQRVAQEPAQPHPLDFGQVRAIVPVVLHPRRRAWRGFDQAILLSRVLSRETGLDCWERVITRVKNTHVQVGLSPEQRRQNMRGAFEVRAPDKVQGGILFLVDDVYTTGSTLQEAAQALRRAGAAQVYGLTLTRATPTWHLGKIVRPGDEDDASSQW